MTSMRSFARLAMTAATTTLAATSVMTALPEAASAATFTVNGTQYDIVTVTNSYNGLLGTDNDLTKQPWFGSQALATSFATEVGTFFGTPNGGAGLLFVWGTQSFPFATFLASQNVGGNLPNPPVANANFTFAVVNSAAPTPIPTPALLPGLVGMGIAAYRKRTLAASTDA